ncbi:uncharacterized protein [Aristolochia californica]|uniref:uncharacterized protein n=1 Tax=Aristolochia californica TaxID=171875 RepID=UPI0035DB3D63
MPPDFSDGGSGHCDNRASSVMTVQLCAVVDNVRKLSNGGSGHGSRFKPAILADVLDQSSTKMTTSFPIPSNCSQVYSIGNLAGSITTIEEKLKRLREWVAMPSSSSDNPTATMLFGAFNDLADLFECANSILQMPLTLQSISHHRHDKWMDNQLDESLRLLEVCSNARNFLLQTKEHLQDLQSALRRSRVSESNMENMFRAYFFTKNKLKKQLEKCLKELKKVDSRWTPSPLLNKDSKFVVVITVLREAKSITLSIFESLLYFISGSAPKSSRKSLVLKWVGTRCIAWEEEIEKMSEAQRVDASLSVFCCQNIHEDVEAVPAECAQRQLEGMDMSIRILGDGLENLFRRLISTRVLLLNILNH